MALDDVFSELRRAAHGHRVTFSKDTLFPSIRRITPTLPPAHECGKFCVREFADTEELFVGFEVEKGTIDDQHGPRRMTGNWLWHAFLKALKSGAIDELVKRQSAGDSWAVHVVVHQPPDWSPDKYICRYQFTGRGDNLEFGNSNGGGLEGLRVDAFESATSLREIGRRIESPDLRFHYVTLLIGRSGFGGELCDNMEGVWMSHCEPFLPWFRSNWG